jgi:hypothetical protein
MINITVGNLEDAVADFQRMAADARELADRHLEGMALAYRGWVYWQNSEFDAAEESLRAALAVGDGGGGRFVGSVPQGHILGLSPRTGVTGEGAQSGCENVKGEEKGHRKSSSTTFYKT